MIVWAFWHIPHGTQQAIDDEAALLYIEKCLLPALPDFLLAQMLAEVWMLLNLQYQI